MSLVMHARNLSVIPVLAEWFGPKVSTTMDDFLLEELEFLMELIIDYQDTRDLNQREWAKTKALLDKLDAVYEKWD
jgi:hypothetical protein